MAFNGEANYENLLDIILEKMMELTNSDAGTLYIMEDEKLYFRIMRNNTLKKFLSAGDRIDLPPIPLTPDNIDNVSSYAAIRNEIVVVDDVYVSERFNFSGPKDYDKITGYRTRSMLVLPLTAYRDDKPKVLGVIQLLNAIDPNTGEPCEYRNVFDPPVIPAIANIASNTLGNLIHLSEIQMLFHSFASAMARAIDERSSYNSNHTTNVTNFAENFAAYLTANYPEGHRLYFDEKRTEEISMAAILHDIGKIITPLEVMDKSDKLSAKLFDVRYRFQIKKLQLENARLSGKMTEDEYSAQSAELENARNLVEERTNPSYISDEQIEEIKTLSRFTYTNCMGEEAPILEPDDIEALSVRVGTLTAKERDTMQEHVSSTMRILEKASFSKYYANVIEWARSHHEFINGTGYPRGLKAEELPIETRILTILISTRR